MFLSVLYLLIVLMMEHVADIVFSFINCGQGTCKASNNSLLGFDCECNPGWRKIQTGPLTFPSCLIPNCQFLSLYFLSTYCLCMYIYAYMLMQDCWIQSTILPTLIKFLYCQRYVNSYEDQRWIGKALMLNKND